MDASRYQQEAQKYALFPLEDSGWDYILSALPEELGEFQAIFAKNARKGYGRTLSEDQRQHALKELGDLAWSMAIACKMLGSTFGAVLSDNINKLEERKRHSVIEGSGETVAERK